MAASYAAAPGSPAPSTRLSARSGLRDRDEAADATRGLIGRIMLTPGATRGEMHATLHGDLGAIIERVGAGKNADGAPQRQVPVAMIAGACIHNNASDAG